MKKVMFAAAVAASMVAFGDITSQNVVGYQDKPISGYTLLTPTFEAIGKAEYPIDNYVVKNATDTQTAIQMLDAAGQVTGIYYWFNESTDPQTGEVYPAGWFDVYGLEPAGVSFKPGDGGLFYTTEQNITAQASGQVGGDVTRDLGGYMILGNPSPVAVAIDNVTVQNATDTQTAIQVLDAEGQVSGIYYWFNESTDPQTGEVYPAGWFDVYGLEPAGITLQPGDSVLFYTTETGVTVKFPGAL